MRSTIIMSREAAQVMTDLTDQYGLTQAEVLETILTTLNPAEFAPALQAKLAAKRERRSQRKLALKALSKLSPEEIAQLAERHE